MEQKEHPLLSLRPLALLDLWIQVVVPPISTLFGPLVWQFGCDEWPLSRSIFVDEPDKPLILGCCPGGLADPAEGLCECLVCTHGVLTFIIGILFLMIINSFQFWCLLKLDVWVGHAAVATALAGPTVLSILTLGQSRDPLPSWAVSRLVWDHWVLVDLLLVHLLHFYK